MATLHNLANPHFSLMTHDERFELIRALRSDRRQVKTKPQKPDSDGEAVKSTLGSRVKRPKKTQLTGDLAGMSQEQLLQLMELLNNGM